MADALEPLAAAGGRSAGRRSKPEVADAGAGLSRFRGLLLRGPAPSACVLAAARQAWPWLLAPVGLAAFGVVAGRAEWVPIAAAVALGLLAWVAWSARRASRWHRLLRHYALGHWIVVRVLAGPLRGRRGRSNDLDFEIELRLAGIRARNHALSDALARLERWRRRLAARPGAFEAGSAEVYLMAGDTAGHVAQMARAHECAPGDRGHALNHALAEARFGSAEQAQALLGPDDATTLAPDLQARACWARGLVALRTGQPAAEPLLARAVAGLAASIERPEVWPTLALCACDHAIALHRAGLHDRARARIDAVWPVLEVHASVPLLRMLEADRLLPPQPDKND